MDNFILLLLGRNVCEVNSANPHSGTSLPGIQREQGIDEEPLLEALRHGDEGAFTALVDKYYGSLLRVAMTYVPSQAVAEEVVQETWMGVWVGLSKFEGRSSLKTWLFRILTNRAKTRGQRERRYESFSSGESSGDESEEWCIEADRFLNDGHWATPPHAWGRDTPEHILSSKENLEQIHKTIGTLPGTQQQVITLRDIEGLSAQEVCNILDITETNQRVLLHRARSRVRKVLDKLVGG